MPTSKKRRAAAGSGALMAALKQAARWAIRPKTLFLNVHFTRWVVRRYCRGRGCEIGPGVNPQTSRATTIYVDRFTHYNQTPIDTDVVADAAALPFGSKTLDYVFSSHVLEHCPDTIRVLNEWSRVLRPGGVLVLRLPHRDRTFDRNRALTPLAHHLEDFARGVGIDDTTHWKDFEENVVRVANSAWKDEVCRPDGTCDMGYLVRHGHIHYHVWTQNEIVDLLRHLGCTIRFVIDDTLDRADSFLVVASVPE